MVSEHCRYVVAGNHDLHAVRRFPHHTTFDYPTNWYELDLPARRSISRGRVWLYEEDLRANLNDRDMDYLRSLPELLVIQAGGVNVLMGHFAYPDLVGDSQTSDPTGSGSLADHFEFMRRHECSIGLAGHDPHDGAVVHTMSGRLAAGFGVIRLPTEPVWIEIPWVANGTSANGAVVLEPPSGVLQTIPLGTQPHVVPLDEKG